MIHTQELFNSSTITKQEVFDLIGQTEFSWPDQVEKAIRGYSRRMLKSDCGQRTAERVSKELLGWSYV